MSTHYEKKVLRDQDATFYATPGGSLISTSMSKGLLG